MLYNRGDETIVCPYDETHSIQKKSFQAHLIRCREANKGKVKMVVCKFDKTHIVAKPELKHHMQDCPSKSVLDREMQCMVNSGNVLTGDVKGPEIKGSHCAEIDEDWDSAPQRVRTKAMFNPPSDGSDDDETESYFPPGANYVEKPSRRRLSQPYEEASEQTQRTVPLTQSKAAMLSEPPQQRTVPLTLSKAAMLPEPAQQRASSSSSASRDGSVPYNFQTSSQPMGATNTGRQDVPLGRSRGLIAANAPGLTTGLSFGRGVTKHASCLTKPAIQPWGQAVTPHQPPVANAPAKFSVTVQPSIHTTSAHSTTSSLPTCSLGTFSDSSSVYSSPQEIPSLRLGQIEEMAAHANKALSANHTRELEELLRKHEQERQQLLHRQEQERVLLLQRQEKERDLAFHQHDQLIRHLLLPSARPPSGEIAMSDSDPSLLSGLQLLTLSQQGNFNLPSSDDRSQKYPGPLSSPGSLSYAQALSTKSVPLSDATSDVGSESWREDESESDSNDRDDNSSPDVLRTMNTTVSDSPNQLFDFSQMTLEDLKQQKKKFEKKLKQIDALERRIYNGEGILPEEVMHTL